MTGSIHETTLRNLRNTRDLRAEILSLAAALAAETHASGRLTLADPAITEATIRKEWESLLPAIAPDVRARMTLAIDAPANKASPGAPNRFVSLDKPNYRFEVLRLLLGASLENGSPKLEAGITAHLEGTQLGLVDTLGASTTPVRSALVALRDAGLIHNLRSLRIAAEALSMEQLSRLGALPQILRFRFERGARIKPSAELLQRAEPLLGPKGPNSWQPFSLSGVPVAHHEAPEVDLIGTPRLDLVGNFPRGDKLFDADTIRLLDDGLEFEPNVLAPAPVVVTLVRADTRFHRDAGMGDVRCGHPCDVFLSLLDLGLRDQALQYAKALRS